MNNGYFLVFEFICNKDHNVQRYKVRRMRERERERERKEEEGRSDL
jgi:hypothetical protein